MKSMLLTLPVIILFGATSCTSSSDDVADNADTVSYTHLTLQTNREV